MSINKLINDENSIDKHCSSSIDRSATLNLIDLSYSTIKSVLNFSQRSEWTEGIESWSNQTINKRTTNKDDSSRRQIDFHPELGIYLPRHEKPNSAPISTKLNQIQRKFPSNRLTPERIRILLRREKYFLDQSDIQRNSCQNVYSSDQRLNPPVPTNTFRQSCSMTNNEEIVCSPRYSLESNKHGNCSIDSDSLKTFLKDHLTNLLNRSNLNSTTINDETKRDESTINLSQKKSTVPLTVTPIEINLNSSKQFQSVSLEKLAQQKSTGQDNESISSQTTTSRPSTQPVPPGSIHFNSNNNLLQRTTNKNSCPTSNFDNFNSNETSKKSSSESTLNRRIPFQNQYHSTGRVSSKTVQQQRNLPTSTTIELLPPIISGKRLHIPLGNHRYL